MVTRFCPCVTSRNSPGGRILCKVVCARGGCAHRGGGIKGMAKTCAQCGAIMAPGDVFCGECGHRAPAGAVTVADQAPADVMSPTSWPGVQWPGTEAPVTPSAGQSAGSTVDAALGQATPNATYLGQRLLYDKTPETP